jgi:hypothetical protein
MKTIFRKIAIGACWLLVFAFVSCQPDVNDILKNPRKYNNKTVELSGKVTVSNGIFGAGYFMLNDGTGEIPVLTKQGLPNEGEEVEVKGKVSQVIKVGDLQGVGIIEDTKAD